MWCAGLAILLAAPLLGQQQPVIRSTSQEVLLDVIVRDKKGRPVRDLKAGEIQVREEGQVQTIRAFRLVDRKGAAAVEEGAAATAPGAPSAASPKTPNFARDIRLVSLVFERLGVDGRRLAKSAALDVLETEKDSNVLFSVFRIDHNLRVVQRFTNDHEALKKAVERAVGGTFSDFAHDLDAANHAVDTTNGSAGTSDQTAQNQGPTGPTQPVNSAGLANEQIGQMMLDMQQFDEMLSSEQQGRESIFPLLAIVKDQQKLPGRKTVLYFSEGLHIPNSLVEQFHSLIGAANRASVSVYAIDARGLLSASQNQPQNIAALPLRADQCALLVVDIQEKLLPPIVNREPLIKNAQLLLRLAGILKLPVLATTQYAKGLGDTVPQIAELFPAKTHAFDKTEFGCFGNEAFCAATKSLPGSRSTLLLCGMETHICVMQTALGALANGYNVHVASDAVGSRAEWNWKVGLDRMKEAGAVISSTETILYELMGGSGTPIFKQMLPYLKA